MTHDYSRPCWGHDVHINKIENGGMTLHVCGWGRGISVDDYLILRDKERTTRYQVKTINYFSDPPGMWSAELSFAPRT